MKINEIIRINPYADIDQVIDPNNWVTTFTLTYEDWCNWDRCVVDWITYSFIWSRYYWKKYSHSWNTLRMRTRDNPSIEDNLQATKVVEKEYFYDDQGPVCRNEGFYKTVDRSDWSVDYDWGWINYNLYYNLQCIDSYDWIDWSWCKTDFGDSVEDRDSGVFKKMSLSKITHWVMPFSGFWDNVWNISDNGTSGGAPRCEPSNIDFVPKVDKQFPVLSPSWITLSENIQIELELLQ